MPGTSTSCPGSLPWNDWMGYYNNGTSVNLAIYDFWKKADPIYAETSSDIWHPNFDTQYKIRNDGSEAVTISRLALAIHYSDGRHWFDMSDPSTGSPRYYDNLVLYPGQSQHFDFSVAYFREAGNYKVVAKYQTTDGVWHETPMDFVVQPEQIPTCTTNSISMNQTISGSWTSGCAATHRSERYAKYYTFTISSGMNIRIDLESSEDTYLFLLSGNGTNGSVLASDDDGGDDTNSHIERNLSSGTYTIEATTYRSGTSGSFALSLGQGDEDDEEICNDGIDNDGDGRTDCSDSDCSDSCGGGCSVSSITSENTNGSWTSSCTSTHRSGRYAKYYTFSLPSSQTVRIFLQSSVDTYLYLLNGNGTNGSQVASDDDGGGGTNSLLERILSAGTYTIEATTYSSGTTGSFTLSVTGGGTNAEICNDGIDNDGDGRTDCSDSDCSDSCGGGCAVSSISRGSSVSGSWTSGCASTHRSGRYARYYTFSVPSGTDIQIDLESSEDTYLFLLSDNGTNGAAIASDDDGGNGTNSLISGTASCSGTCTYTIEATTYRIGTTGSFTLRLQ